MKSRIFLTLIAFLMLAATTAVAQMDSAALAKKQKEIAKTERTISKAKSKVDRKERKMQKAQKRADRKQRKREKKLDKLKKAERKREQLIRDTTKISYLQPLQGIPFARFQVPAPIDNVTWQQAPDPADRLTKNVIA